MKKTMFITAMLITVLVTMLAANFAFAAAPAPITSGAVSANIHRDDSGKDYGFSTPAGYVPMILATGNRALFQLDRADRFDSVIK